ncbi:MAG: hypothetical protein JRK26_21220 [Deltaproteobacteria bacterium]|nr:hypothetical protein [Deltaproteobacteria bacterium]
MDPYGSLTDRPPSIKSDVTAEIVTVFGNKRDKRGLKLITPYTRAVLQGQIHEFIITDEKDARPSSTVDRVGYLCFAEIKKGGAIMFGDKILVGEQLMGRLVGFDEYHMPNHLNIVLYADYLKSGFDLGISVGQDMLITDKI